jgi:hypothetical protein
MEVKASIVLASHLSDLQIETTMKMSKPEGQQEIEQRIGLRLEFIKFLNWKLKGDFTQEIDPEKLYEIFLYERKN